MGSFCRNQPPQNFSSRRFSPASYALLFSSIHCYLDPSSGAALCTRELLELLAARGADCRVLTTGILDPERETSLDEVLATLELPTQRLQAELGPGGSAEVIDLGVNGVPVTLMPTVSSRAERSPDPRESAIFLELADQVFDRFRPDVLLTYGGHPASLELMRRARQRPAPGVPRHGRILSQKPQVHAGIRPGLVRRGNCARGAAQITWYHNLTLIEKLKEREERLWYAQETVKNGWSRNVLVHWIESDLYERQGKASTNFEQSMPRRQSDLARELLKDPYDFQFLTMAREAEEREIEQGLVAHIREFLLELGAGFAFLGQQFKLEVGGEEFFIDLLFYHVKLRGFVENDVRMKAEETRRGGCGKCGELACDYSPA